MLFLRSKHYNILQSFQLKFFKINITFSKLGELFLNFHESSQAKDVACIQIPRMRSLANWSSVSCSQTVLHRVRLIVDAGTSVINILNSLEQMNYKVVTSGSFVASQSFNNNKVSTYRKVSLSTRSYLTNSTCNLF